MGNLEAVELQILELVIPAGSVGLNRSLAALHNDLRANNAKLAEMRAPEANELIVTVLIDLVNSDCIQVRHYDGSETWRRQGTETPENFDRGTFTCTRVLPGAFKRREALVAVDKHGVFISHNVPEGALPVVIKRFLASSLGPEYPICVSSDLRSIPSGAQWFSEIVRAAKTAEVVLVLVTPESMNQRWLNLEAGIGIGAGTVVIPMLARGMSKDDLLPPLKQLQARDLSNKDDLTGMIKDLEDRLRSKWTKEAIDALFVELQQVSTKLGELDRATL